MLIAIIILWYLFGVFGGLFILRKIDPETTVGDLLFSLTFGGISGPLTVIYGLRYLPKPKWLEKKLF